MKVLVVGGGGREHALAWKLAQSARVTEVLVAPGNAGTAAEPGVKNVDVGADNIDALLELARAEEIDLTVVGPEAPLVGGISDRFTDAGLRCFGPSAAAAELEGSKAYTKAFMQRHGIPSGAYESFDDAERAIEYIKNVGAPIVIKADGLAAGKGVVVAQSIAEAETAVRDMLQSRRFGAAGTRIVVEEFLDGEEASFIAIVGGGHILSLATSQDHKARDNGDLGPNTGGMGAYSPAPVMTPEVTERVLERVMRPTIAGLAKDGIAYTGFLYAGLMIDTNGNPGVLEFNCRFGDPETQPILFRMKSDLVDHLEAALDGRLDGETALWDTRVSLGVVMAAGGYPEKYRKGDIIRGLPANPPEHLKVFHAGTGNRDGEVVTSGGRVLCAVALGDTVAEAQAQAYELVRQISWPDAYYRTDIGYRAIAREARRS